MNTIITIHIYITRHKFIHHHQYMFTVSNQNNVHSILSNWRICIHISCGQTSLQSFKVEDVSSELQS